MGHALVGVALFGCPEIRLKLPFYPSGAWYFNPLAWQLLFVPGAWFALTDPRRCIP